MNKSTPTKFNKFFLSFGYVESEQSSVIPICCLDEFTPEEFCLKFGTILYDFYMKDKREVYVLRKCLTFYQEGMKYCPDCGMPYKNSIPFTKEEFQDIILGLNCTMNEFDCWDEITGEGFYPSLGINSFEPWTKYCHISEAEIVIPKIKFGEKVHSSFFTVVE